MLTMKYLPIIAFFVWTSTASETIADHCVEDLEALNKSDANYVHNFEEVAEKYGLKFESVDVTLKVFCHDAKSQAAAAFARPKVWIASIIAMTIISAVGLLGVAVVPLVQKAFFNSVIQYLVAVAVGTLTGDAFLHLMPHSISDGGGHTHKEAGGGAWLNKERVKIFKALVALGGIYFFFLAEKAVTMISESRAEKKAEEEEQRRAAANPRKSIDAKKKLGARRPSGLRRPSAFLETPEGPLRRGSRMLQPMPQLESQQGKCGRQNRALSFVDDNIMTIGLSSRAMKDIDNLYRYAEQSEEESDDAFEAESKTDGDISLAVPQIGIKDGTKSENSEPKKDHSHGHSHEIPESIVSVAWMVILGDGLHNFTDGLAIGAAFAKSISGGISTSVAVFCHELPHELGDFAVLLKTGMRIREAMYFNIISSVLAFIGMIIGTFLGTIEGINTWIFLFTAGTFIYIALVDMLPQLTGYEVRVGDSRLGLFLIQNLGLMTGVSIMLVIALFEEEMMKMLG